MFEEDSLKIGLKKEDVKLSTKLYNNIEDINDNKNPVIEKKENLDNDNI